MAAENPIPASQIAVTSESPRTSPYFFEDTHFLTSEGMAAQRSIMLATEKRTRGDNPPLLVDQGDGYLGYQTREFNDPDKELSSGEQDAIHLYTQELDARVARNREGIAEGYAQARDQYINGLDISDEDRQAVWDLSTDASLSDIIDLTSPYPAPTVDKGEDPRRQVSSVTQLSFEQPIVDISSRVGTIDLGLKAAAD